MMLLIGADDHIYACGLTDTWTRLVCNTFRYRFGIEWQRATESPLINE